MFISRRDSNSYHLMYQRMWTWYRNDFYTIAQLVSSLILQCTIAYVHHMHPQLLVHSYSIPVAAMKLFAKKAEKMGLSLHVRMFPVY